MKAAILKFEDKMEDNFMYTGFRQRTASLCNTLSQLQNILNCGLGRQRSIIRMLISNPNYLLSHSQ